MRGRGLRHGSWNRTCAEVKRVIYWRFGPRGLADGRSLITLEFQGNSIVDSERLALVEMNTDEKVA